MLRRIAASLIVPVLIPAQLLALQVFRADASEQASVYAKPGVVRVFAGCSGKYSYGSVEYSFAVGEVGSGFFISPDGYIVTNYHILRPSEKDGCEDYVLRNLAARIEGKNTFDSIPERTKKELKQSSRITSEINYFMRVVLPNGESFPFEIKKTGKPVAGGSEDLGVIKVQLSNAPTLQFGDSNTTKLQDAVTTVSYPLNGEPSSFFAPLLNGDLPGNQPLGKATVDDGRVLDIQRDGKGNNSLLQLNAKLALGSSGSPVLNEKGEVIGIATLSDENSGNNVVSAIPSSTIVPFIREYDRTNQENPTNQLYRDGLNLLEKKDYKGAKAAFEKLKNLFPYHSEVYWLMIESNQKLTESQKKVQKLLLMFGVGGIGLALLGSYLYFKRNRRQPQLESIDGETLSIPISNQPQPISPVAPEPLNAPNLTEYYPSQAAVTQIGGYSSATVIGTQPFVELKNQDGQVKRFYLSRNRHRLGRDRSWSDLFIPDNGWEVLSRRHATLEREGDDYRIYDGDRQNPSTNGLLINDTPINSQEGHLLKDGDEIRTGQDSRNQVVLTYSNPGTRHSSTPDLQTNASGDASNNSHPLE